MKTLLTLFILLFSSLVLSREGDVYYCETNNFTFTIKDNIEEYQNFKFKFKRTKNKIIFGKNSFFEDVFFSKLRKISLNNILFLTIILSIK